MQPQSRSPRVQPSVNRLAEELRLAVTRLARRLRQHAEEGLSPSQLSALSTIDRRGPMTLGDVASAVHVASAVDSGARLGPLLFYQSVPNAVAGYVATRWRLTGPVVCTSPAADELTEGLAVARLLIDDGDCDEALVVVPRGEGPDSALAVLVGVAEEET